MILILDLVVGAVRAVAAPPVRKTHVTKLTFCLQEVGFPPVVPGVAPVPPAPVPGAAPVAPSVPAPGSRPGPGSAAHECQFSDIPTSSCPQRQRHELNITFFCRNLRLRLGVSRQVGRIYNGK